jgi:beta-N-acetylhexosaminidase
VTKMTRAASLRHDAHRVVLGSFTGTVLPRWLPELVAAGLGGVCLYGDNVGAVDGDIAELARALRELDPRAVLAVDEEGGEVTRLHTRAGSPYPGNAVLGRFDEAATTRDVAAAIGAELGRCGIWLDLAPVADVNSNPLNPVIGTRSFGDDPDLVARHTVAFVEGLQSQGVAACVKHFPGHGDTSVDSHLGLPRVSADESVLAARELVPFAAGVQARAAAVMTSHVVVEAVDADRPATLSPVVLAGLLRRDLGFDGLVVTDALDMAGASSERGIPGAAVASLAAGADLLCIGPAHGRRGPDHILAVVAEVVRAVDRGELDRERLADAAERVQDASRAWGGAGEPRPAAVELGIRRGRTAAAAILPEAVDLGPGEPLLVRVDSGTNPAVGETRWGGVRPLGARVLDTVGGWPDVEAVAAHDGPLLVEARRATADQAGWQWVRDVAARRPDLVLIELGWPDPALAGLDHVILGWGSSRPVVEALTALVNESLR